MSVEQSNSKWIGLTVEQAAGERAIEDAAWGRAAALENLYDLARAELYRTIGERGYRSLHGVTVRIRVEGYAYGEGDDGA